jgi:hypothetical protein
VASRFTTTEVLPSKTPPAEKLAEGPRKSEMNSTHASGIGAAMKKMGFSQRSGADTEDGEDEGDDEEDEGEDNMDIKNKDLIVSI